jgi:hypothetical protein
VHWGIAHRVGVNAVTDALVFMAVTMLVTRTLGIWARAASLAGAANDEPAGAAIGAQR